MHSRLARGTQVPVAQWVTTPADTSITRHTTPNRLDMNHWVHPFDPYHHRCSYLLGLYTRISPDKYNSSTYPHVSEVCISSSFIIILHTDVETFQPLNIHGYPKCTSDSWCQQRHHSIIIIPAFNVLKLLAHSHWSRPILMNVLDPRVVITPDTLTPRSLCSCTLPTNTELSPKAHPRYKGANGPNQRHLCSPARRISRKICHTYSRLCFLLPGPGP